jgi:hypothetical protein
LSRDAGLGPGFGASIQAGEATSQELMSELIIPLPEAEPWPTLGPGVCRFIEEYVIRRPRGFVQAWTKSPRMRPA